LDNKKLKNFLVLRKLLNVIDKGENFIWHLESFVGDDAAAGKLRELSDAD